MWIPQGEEKRKQWWKMSTSLHTCLVFPFRGPHPLPSLPLLCITFLSINSFHVLSNGTSIYPSSASFHHQISCPSSGHVHTINTWPLWLYLQTSNMCCPSNVRTLDYIRTYWRWRDSTSDKKNKQERKTQPNTQENICMMIYNNCMK